VTSVATATDEQIAQAAAAAGFNGHDLEVSVAVALAESRGRTDVRNSIGASGAWQILQSAHPELFRAYHWQNLDDNAKMAHAVWAQAGRKWTPWVTYVNGAYLMFMPRAKRAVAHMGGGSATPTQTAHATDASFAGTVGGLSPLLDFAGFIGNPHNWQRLAFFAAGGALIVLALMRWTGTDKVVAQAGKTVAKTAAEMAVVA
jgi:hypothetical protein